MIDKRQIEDIQRDLMDILDVRDIDAGVLVCKIGGMLVNIHFARKGYEDHAHFLDGAVKKAIDGFKEAAKQPIEWTTEEIMRREG